jgi:hypothetical protein
MTELRVVQVHAMPTAHKYSHLVNWCSDFTDSVYLVNPTDVPMALLLARDMSVQIVSRDTEFLALVRLSVELNELSSSTGETLLGGWVGTPADLAIVYPGPVTVGMPSFPIVNNYLLLGSTPDHPLLLSTDYHQLSVPATPDAFLLWRGSRVPDFSTIWQTLYRETVEYRQRGDNATAYLRAQSIIDLAVKTDLTGISPVAVDELYYELALICHDMGDEKLATEYTDRALLSHHLNLSSRHYLLYSRRDRIVPLPTLSQLDLYYPIPPGHAGCNPSIIKLDNGEYICNVRLVTYVIPTYHRRDGRDEPNCSLNVMCHLSQALDVIKWTPMVDRAPQNYARTGLIRGMEDLRFFTSHDFFCTVLGCYTEFTPRIAWGSLDNAGNVVSLVHLDITPPDRVEKNWLPFLHAGEPHFIYSYHPLIIYKLNNGTPIRVVERYVTSTNLEHFRGSAAPVRHKDGYLFTVHQVCHTHDARIYFHRFAWLSHDFETLKYSHLFCFERAQIEYSIGLTLLDDTTALIIYSVNDERTKAVTVALSDINRRLGI